MIEVDSNKNKATTTTLERKKSKVTKSIGNDLVDVAAAVAAR